MNKTYFNEFEFQKIVELKVTNPYEAVMRMQEYIKKYPSDYRAFLYYITFLSTIKEIDKACELLNQFEITLAKDGHFQSFNERMINIKKAYLYTKLKLLMDQEKYKEAYTLCLRDFNKVDMHLSEIIFFLQTKLGMIERVNRDQSSYLRRQMIDYQEKDFFNHIKKHQADYNRNLSNRNTSIFESNLDILLLVNEIKKYIPSNKGIYKGFWEDTYYFKYDENGRFNNRLTDYFMVVSLKNTNELISMYPSLEGKYFDYVDLNYLKKDEEIKVKRISQTEKFYKRYGKK